MIVLATPISHLFKDKEVGRTILEHTDWLECREWCIESDWPRQKLFHFDINLNHPWTEEIRHTLKLAIDTKPELALLSMQMASCCDAPVISNGMYLPGGTRYSRREMLEHAARNLKWLRGQASGRDIAFAVENNNYYPTPAYDDVTEGSFISDVVEQNDVHLLLDIAHAKVTAHNSGMPYDNYLESLPMARVIQLHICQPAFRTDGMAFDAHEYPSTEMQSEVEALSAKWPVQYLTVEYYKDPVRLIESLDAMSQIRDRIVQVRKYGACPAGN
jgi:hypothetical protein